MIEQQGLALAASDGRVRVRLGGASGCAACDAGRGCGAGVLGRWLARRPVELELVDPVGVRTGQAVMVGLPESVFLRLVGLLYGLPLAAGLAGAGIGHYFMQRMSGSPAAADIGAGLGLLMAAAAAAAWARRRARPGWATEVRLLRAVRAEGCGPSPDTTIETERP